VDPERFNPETVEAWRQDKGTDFRRSTRAERDAWYNLVFARYAADLAARARALRPGLEVTVANCWWMDPHAAVHAQTLPGYVRVAVWYYNWQDHDPEPWPIYRWSDLLGPGRVLYMPTSTGYLYPSDSGERRVRHRGNDRLISTADALGVRDLVYFAGFGAGSAQGREIDAELALRPASAAAKGAVAKWRAVAGLYRDYAGTRRALGLPESVNAAFAARRGGPARGRPCRGWTRP
jgi:hypothetical protein